MKDRTRYVRIVRIYAIAAALALALYAYTESVYLTRWRQTAAYTSSLAFEETVRAVDSLSRSLEKSLYAADGAMCARVCSEAYAASRAAGSAMAALPFSTQELENLSAFLNRTGDYARTLCGESAEAGLRPEQREALGELSMRADEFVEVLLALREDLNGGHVHLDSREKRLRNVGAEPGESLAARLLDYEASFAAPAELHYDGLYGKEERPGTGYLTEEEMREAAAAFLGVSGEELEPVYSYEGLEGRRCFRCGDSFLCVSRSGVDSLSQTRLVSEAVLSAEEAQAEAETFLRRAGYTELNLVGQRDGGTVLSLDYARTEDGALWLDNLLRVAVALDDGSIYSFNADAWQPGESGVRWTLSEEEAAAALPDDFAWDAARRVILTSEGGRNSACYEFSGPGRDDGRVRLYVNAVDGKQERITID